MVYFGINTKNFIYRCQNTRYRKRKSACRTRLDSPTLIHIVYLLISGSTYKQIYIFHGLSDATIASIKTLLSKCNTEYMNTCTIFLGGSEIIVGVDETVLSI